MDNWDGRIKVMEMAKDLSINRGLTGDVDYDNENMVKTYNKMMLAITFDSCYDEKEEGKEVAEDGLQTAKMTDYGYMYSGRAHCIIKDHPKVVDGNVITSKVKAITGNYLFTENTKYDLTEVSELDKSQMMIDFVNEYNGTN